MFIFHCSFVIFSCWWWSICSGCWIRSFWCFLHMFSTNISKLLMHNTQHKNPSLCHWYAITKVNIYNSPYSHSTPLPCPSVNFLTTKSMTITQNIQYEPGMLTIQKNDIRNVIRENTSAYIHWNLFICRSHFVGWSFISCWFQWRLTRVLPQIQRTFCTTCNTSIDQLSNMYTSTSSIVSYISVSVLHAFHRCQPGINTIENVL